MASLYIKDSEVAGRVHRIAQRLGTTKTEAVSRALAALEERIGPDRLNRQPGFAERMSAYRADHPLPPKIRETDKAFYDRLWNEPDD